MDNTPLRRALSVAVDRPAPPAAEADHELFVFRVGELTLGIASDQVREVTRMGQLTPLPRTPSFVLGVVGHRGQVMPVIDLLRFLGQGETRPTDRSRLFIGDSASYVVGFVADSVVGLRRFKQSECLPAPLGGGSMQEFLTQLVQARDLGTVSVLQLPRVVQAARLKAVPR